MAKEIPAWKIASNKIHASKLDSKEYNLAYAEYYEALMINGDSNGYYNQCKKEFLNKASKQ